MKLKSLAAALTIAIALASCSTSKTVLPYFNDISEIKDGTFSTDEILPKLQPDDELYITVNSLNPEVSAQYNLAVSNPAKASELIATTTPQQQTYIVTSDGNINFPVLGTVHVAGKNTEQVQKELTEIISKDVDNPVVRVQLVNFKVNVTGEVAKPGAQKVSTQRYTILDALAEAGDLTAYGERNNVLLIRQEDDGQYSYHHINLNSTEVLTSPYFYLKQNDYIYVQPNSVRQANAKYNQDNAYKVTVILLCCRFTNHRTRCKIIKTRPWLRKTLQTS
jgi:polysaccharide export outer membrane protein